MTSVNKLILTAQPYYPYITLTGLTYIYMYIKFPHMLLAAKHWFDSRNRPCKFDSFEWCADETVLHFHIALSLIELGYYYGENLFRPPQPDFLHAGMCSVNCVIALLLVAPEDRYTFKRFGRVVFQALAFVRLGLMMTAMIVSSDKWLRSSIVILHSFL